MRVRVVDDGVGVAALGPQVNHFGFDARQAVVVFANAGVLVAGDAAGEGHFAFGGEHGRVVETAAAGHEPPITAILGLRGAAIGIQLGRQHGEAGAVGLRVHLDHPSAPAYRRAGMGAGGGLLRRQGQVFALQRCRMGHAAAEQRARKGQTGDQGGLSGVLFERGCHVGSSSRALRCGRCARRSRARARADAGSVMRSA